MSTVSWYWPYKDELLSSWLARVAVHSGCDPLTLTGAIWPKWRIWTVDVDRGLTASRAMQAAQWFECEPETVHAATLQDLRVRLHGSTAQYSPVLPWITTLGSRNRLRYAGSPCCPQCLASDPQPFFRRAWRLAFVVGCEVHGSRLIDRCPYCRALIAPHRCISKLQNLGRCSTCGEDVCRYVPSAVEADALTFQRLALNVLITGEGLWGCDSVPSVEWFRRVRSAVTPSRCEVVRTESQKADLRPHNLLLEMQSPREREARFCGLVTILRQGKVQPVRRSTRLQGTKRALQNAEKSPISVSKECVQADWERWLRRNRRW